VELQPQPGKAAKSDAPQGAFSTLTEAAYSRIREEIIAGRLKPSEKLTLERLREMYGFGASPLREALSRLAADNLVIAQGQKGYWVAPVSRAEFEDIIDIRTFIEAEALRRSIENASLDWESDVVRVYHRLSKIEATLDKDAADRAQQWERENRLYHLTLIEKCGSAWLLRIAARLFEQSERYRRQAVTRQAVPKKVLQDQHKAIFDAALARDARRACDLLRQHIRSTAASVAEMLF
jgi:DNA-binding GntR family transcriptional regulator